MALDLNDKSGNSNTLTNVNTVTEITTNLPITVSSSGAQLVSASSQAFTAADSATLSITGSFTIECWVKFSTLPSSGNAMAIVSKYDQSSDKRSYLLQLYNSSGTYQLWGEISTDGTNQSANQKQVDWTPSADTWYHIALVYDSSAPSFRFYVNGSQQGATQGLTGTSVFNSDRVLSLGSRDHESSPIFYLNGYVDDVRIWNVIRSSSEILLNREYELVGTETGLKAYWPFEASLTPAPRGGLLGGGEI